MAKRLASNHTDTTQQKPRPAEEDSPAPAPPKEVPPVVWLHVTRARIPNRRRLECLPEKMPDEPGNRVLLRVRDNRNWPKKMPAGLLPVVAGRALTPELYELEKPAAEPKNPRAVLRWLVLMERRKAGQPT